MYDILQLNDMLVPELLDIAEQLKITGAKKMDKQQLVYKILDKQAVMSSETKGAEEKGKRKRIVKTTTASGTEEAVVESGDEAETPAKNKKKKEEAPAPQKKTIKKADKPSPTEPIIPAGFIIPGDDDFVAGPPEME
ncbi:MAG: Rho termination factor N-terminal domain-containing protein, partial [Lacibacter sp.]